MIIKVGNRALNDLCQTINILFLVMSIMTLPLGVEILYAVVVINFDV